jgi:hypothetical protein
VIEEELEDDGDDDTRYTGINPVHDRLSRMRRDGP